MPPRCTTQSRPSPTPCARPLAKSARCGERSKHWPLGVLARPDTDCHALEMQDEEKLQEERQERLDEEAAEGDEEEADSDGGDGPGDDTLTGLRQAEAPEPPPPPPKKKKKKQKQAETLNFKAPKLDEEESESTSIPVRYRCEACAAVAFQIQRGLLAAEIKYAGLKVGSSPKGRVPSPLPAHACNQTQRRNGAVGSRRRSARVRPAGSSGRWPKSSCSRRSIPIFVPRPRLMPMGRCRCVAGYWHPSLATAPFCGNLPNSLRTCAEFAQC